MNPNYLYEMMRNQPLRSDINEPAGVPQTLSGLIAMENARLYAPSQFNFTPQMAQGFDQQAAQGQADLAKWAEQQQAKSMENRKFSLDEMLRKSQITGQNLENIQKMIGMGGGTPVPKLKPGERWNAEQQRVESVPGSSEYIKQSGQHAKDYAAQKTTEQKMDFAIDRVNELLDPNNKAMIERNFGGYNAYISQFLPGAGLQGKNKVEALKSTLKNAGLEMMRTGGSIGQMTEREWPIVERMIANINPSLSEDDAITELGKIGRFMKNIKDRAQETYQSEWGNTQFYKENKATEQPTMKQKSNLSAQDMQAIDWAMKNRSDPRAQQIMQRLGVR